MLPSPSPRVFHLDIRLSPNELVTAWRTDVRRLVLPTHELLCVRQRVAARIATIGSSVTATITGRVTSSTRHENGYRIELVPDEMRLRALERLVAVARGEVVTYQPRVPRLLATMPAVVHGPAGPTYMTTFSVSENGCGLAWTGPVPAAIGAKLDIRFGAGSRSVTFRSEVRWTARSGSTATVGVRFVAGAKDTWAMLLTEAKQSGAPPA
jgi:hypothetical protein